MGRIQLRELKLINATKEYVGWINDNEVNKFLTTKETTLSELKKYIKKQIRNPKVIFLGIFTNKGIHIGNVKLEINKETAEFGILIGNKKYWNKGYGTEATKLICKYAFKELKLEVLELGVLIENKYAIKLYKNLGFKKKILRMNLNYYDFMHIKGKEIKKLIQN